MSLLSCNVVSPGCVATSRVFVMDNYLADVLNEYAKYIRVLINFVLIHNIES